MSGFADLCECLCRQFSHQMDTVNAILQAVNGQEVVTSQGFGDSTTAFGLPPRPTSGVSGSALAMMTMIVLFVMLLLSLRRQIQDTNQERDVTLTKATSSSASSSSGHPRRDDPNRDRDFLQ